MSLRLAALCAAVLIGFVAPSSVSAHEGHDHDEAPAPIAADGPPAAESSSALFELVVKPRDGGLDLWLDRFATNEPVEGARIAIDTPGGEKTARAEPGKPYRLEGTVFAQPGHLDLIATVTAGGDTDVLPLSIDIPPAPAPGAVAAAATTSVAGPRGTLAAALGIGALIGLGFGALLSRRRVRVPVALVALAILLSPYAAKAHDGEDHGEGPAVATSGALAHRLADGSIQVPKPLQRLFDIRTVVAANTSAPRTIELPGRIIPDPNASGFVQASVGGRLSPPQGGFPRLGTPVKAGDVLAYVAPPLQAIDRSDMRQRQGELDQQIAIVERRVQRFEYLAQGNAVSKTQLDEARLELDGLRQRRASLDKARAEPEALTAPVSGIIADGNPVAGQVVQANAVIYQIIDPERLWVEALSTEALPSGGAATATTSGGASLPLAFRGSGFADRSQSVPVHYAVEGATAKLRAGQFVTVLVPAAETREGIAVPRTALVRAANGQDFVFDHVGAERFMPRPVRAEPLDGTRVVIRAGVEPGARIVVQGSELLNQVR